MPINPQEEAGLVPGTMLLLGVGCWNSFPKGYVNNSYSLPKDLTTNQGTIPPHFTLGNQWVSWDCLLSMGECSLHVIDFPAQSYYVNSVHIELCLFPWEECLCLPKECLWQDVTSHPQHNSLLLHSKALCKQPSFTRRSSVSWTIVTEHQ